MLSSQLYLVQHLAVHGALRNPLIGHLHRSLSLSLMCLVVASAKEIEDPGCFHEVLSSLQIINKVPKFKFGDINPPNFQVLIDNRNAMGTPDRDDEAGSIIDAPGSSSPPDVPQPSQPNVPMKFPKINVVKKKTAPAVTAANLEKMVRDGHVLFETSEKLSQKQCLDLMKSNLLECKIALSKVKSRDFRSLKSFM